MTRTTPRCLALGAGLLAAGAVCQAAPVFIVSDNANRTDGRGSFAGTIEYTPVAATAGSLLITITNTSSAGNGGFLTALAFNVNSPDPRRRAMLFFGPHNWSGHAGMNAQPFGSGFDGGASSFNNPGNPFQGGGPPHRGIGVGETGVFDFMIFADDADRLTAEDFIANGPFEVNFVARFRGFDDGGADTVPGQMDPMPLPGAAAMAGAVLMGLVARRRRR